MRYICVKRLLAIAVLAATAIGLHASGPGWRIGAEVEPAWVLPTNGWLSANGISTAVAGTLKADFRFSRESRTGRLYHGLYQGIGVGVRGFAGGRLGTPVSVFVYQGAPFAHLNRRLTLGYEWQFGIAAGWRHSHDEGAPNRTVSTAVTAHMGVGLRLNYRLTDSWQLSAGVQATHFSNGNTSYPNAGVNNIGVTLGAAYLINVSEQYISAPPEIAAEADSVRWQYDLVAYGAWRKRVLMLGGSPQLCPGRFGVAGLQFAPLCRLNRYVGVGPALDLQYNESAGLAPYWVEGTSGDSLKFYRPPFFRQLSIGLSAHAELTMPVFAVNVGLGYDLLSPKGERRFYQSLTLKAFVTRRLFLNVGYRLGRFQDPQNLMLGLGVRI